MKKYVIAESLGGEDIRRLRDILGMTQKEFSVFAGVSKRTVELWEAKTEGITGPVVALAEILLRKPSLAAKLELPENRLKMRLRYMYKNMVCTVIDVDDPGREVEIHNYVDDPLYRAFGVNTEPEYEDYLAFLESRCFPRTRDKMKLELKEIGVPFYDPFMIIEKTQGRMAEDEFWLMIER